MKRDDMTRREALAAAGALAAAMLAGCAPGAGAGAGSRDYVVVAADASRALLVEDPGDAKAYRLDVSGFGDVGAGAGDLVRVFRPSGFAAGGFVDELNRDPVPLRADGWELLEKGAVAPGGIECAEKYAWFEIMGGCPDSWQGPPPAGGEQVMAGGPLAVGVPVASRLGFGVLSDPGDVRPLLGDAVRVVGPGGGAAPADAASLSREAARLEAAIASGALVVRAGVVLPYASQRPDVAGVRYSGGRYVVDVRVLRGDGEASDTGAGAWVLLAPVEPRELAEGGPPVRVGYHAESDG